MRGRQVFTSAPGFLRMSSKASSATSFAWSPIAWMFCVSHYAPKRNTIGLNLVYHLKSVLIELLNLFVQCLGWNQ